MSRALALAVALMLAGCNAAQPPPSRVTLRGGLVYGPADHDAGAAVQVYDLGPNQTTRLLASGSFVVLSLVAPDGALRLDADGAGVSWRLAFDDAACTATRDDGAPVPLPAAGKLSRTSPSVFLLFDGGTCDGLTLQMTWSQA